MSKQTDLINIPDAITVSGAVVTESASAGTVEHTINNETSSGNRYSMLTFKDQGTNKYYQYQNHNDGNVLFRNEHATGSLQFMTGGANERLRIDSSGRVTTPYQPSFLASEATGFSMSSKTMKSFQQIQHNIGGHFDNSTGLFTAPVAGKYLVNAGVLVSGETGRLEFAVEVNSGPVAINGNGTGTTFDGPTASGVFNLSANDSIRVQLGSGTPYDGGDHGNTYFGVTLLG